MLLGAAIAALAPGRSTTSPTRAARDTQPTTSIGPLDGMAFVGEFGAEGEPADRTDALHFGNGKFWSANCVPCGFQPSVYWTRRTSRDVRFRGTLRSLDSGTFTYKGFVRDGRIQVDINWRKDRWYWSIDRNFWFKGELARERNTGTAAQAARTAMAAEPDPNECTL